MKYIVNDSSGTAPIPFNFYGVTNTSTIWNAFTHCQKDANASHKCFGLATHSTVDCYTAVCGVLERHHLPVPLSASSSNLSSFLAEEKKNALGRKNTDTLRPSLANRLGPSPSSRQRQVKSGGNKRCLNLLLLLSPSFLQLSSTFSCHATVFLFYLLLVGVRLGTKRRTVIPHLREVLLK